MTPEGLVKRKAKELCIKHGGLFRFITYIAKVGCPDCKCLLPDGKILYIEAKSARGRLSTAQLMEAEAYAKRGFKVWCPKSEEEVMEIFNAV